jgi:tRNA threonylcarbamoyladenosine biosynthesis protein TsaB
VSEPGPAANVLAIDTSTELCSAAVVTRDGRSILRSMLTERSHADLILPMIDEVLAEARLQLQDLDGLAFGRGPGGFTGLRIAAGVIQGLAFGAGLKVAPVSSLAAVAYQVFITSSASAGEVARSAGEESVLVCNDARMNELYWACYRVDAAAGIVALTPERVSPPDHIVPPAGIRHFAGNGVARFPDLRARLEAAGLQFHDGLYPRADAIAHLGAAILARGEGVDAKHAVPTYVRDDVARPAAGPPVT